MKRKYPAAELQKIKDALDVARDVLATNHAFTRLIEDELDLDVKLARADAWISVNKTVQFLLPSGPCGGDDHAFDEYGYPRSERSELVAMLTDLLQEIRRAKTE